MVSLLILLLRTTRCTIWALFYGTSRTVIMKTFHTENAKKGPAIGAVVFDGEVNGVRNIHKLTGPFAFENCDSRGGMDSCIMYERISNQKNLLKAQYSAFNPC